MGKVARVTTACLAMLILCRQEGSERIPALDGCRSDVLPHVGMDTCQHTGGRLAGCDTGYSKRTLPARAKGSAAMSCVCMYPPTDAPFAQSPIQPLPLAGRRRHFRLVPWHYNFDRNFSGSYLISDGLAGSGASARLCMCMMAPPQPWVGAVTISVRLSVCSVCLSVRPSSVAFVCEDARMGRADVRKEVIRPRVSTRSRDRG